MMVLAVNVRVIFLTVCLMVLLIALYFLNSVQQTSDLAAVMRELIIHNPTTVAYTLKRDKKSLLYHNVYLKDSNLEEDHVEIEVKHENFPVTREGKYITDENRHGRVVDEEDGFTITGIDFVKFKCPEGYGSSSCVMKAICEEGDIGKRKLLTYAQFNALHLYRNDFGSKPIGGEKSGELTHQRLSVMCGENGKFDLEHCGDNELLNAATLNCERYDLCEDRMYGFKHNLPISKDDPALADDEYYLCENNKSVKRKCDEGTVFSGENKGCIMRSVCLNQGAKQIWRDDNSYINCKNDVGTVINCSQGVVIDKNGVMSCKTSTCVSQESVYEDSVLKFSYAKTECDANDRPRVTRCDDDPVYPQPSMRYRWMDDFDVFTHENWPKQVYDSRRKMCVKPTDSIIKDDAFEYVSWSDLMYDKHKFNLKKREFECTDEHKYRWDYVRGVVVPKPPTIDSRGIRLYVDSASPCQKDVRTNDDMPWQGMFVERFPNGLNSAPGVFIAETDMLSEYPTLDKCLWPCYDKTSKKYIGVVPRYDANNRYVNVRVYRDDIPPLGFIRNSDYQRLKRLEAINVVENVEINRERLHLLGTDKSFPAAEYYDSFVWYTISSGVTSNLIFSDAAESDESLKIQTPSEVNTADYTANALSCYIFWMNIKDDKEEFTVLNNGELILRKNGIWSNGTLMAVPALLKFKMSRSVTNEGIKLSFTYGSAANFMIERTLPADIAFHLP